jgi:hypothetical protein
MSGQKDANIYLPRSVEYFIFTDDVIQTSQKQGIRKEFAAKKDFYAKTRK